MADEPSEWALREAAEIVKELTLFWCMRDPCPPDFLDRIVARTLDAARRQGREEMRERAACELDGVVVPKSGRIGWGKVADVANAIRALPLDEEPTDG